MTPSLSSEHLSNTVYHRLDSFHFSVPSCHATQTCKTFLIAAVSFQHFLRDLGWCLLCSVRYRNESHLSIDVCHVMLHHIQGSNSSLWPRAKTSASCTSVHVVSSLLCLNALNLASAWCLEHDFVRLRKVSRDWYRAFDYVPDVIVQTRFELQHSTYSHRWWRFSGYGSTRVLITLVPVHSSRCSAPAPCDNFNDESSGHDPRHNSCYDSTVWSMMLWDVSFSLGAVPVTPVRLRFGSGVTNLVL